MLPCKNKTNSRVNAFRMDQQALECVKQPWIKTVESIKAPREGPLHLSIQILKTIGNLDQFNHFWIVSRIWSKCKNVDIWYVHTTRDIHSSSKFKQHQKTREWMKCSGYPVFIQNFIIRNNFLNILSFSTNANHAIITAYGPDLENNQKICR